MGSVQKVSLPQNDKDSATRKQNLTKARQTYQLEQKTFGLNANQITNVNLVDVPPLLGILPNEEKRSFLDSLIFYVRGLFYYCFYLYHVFRGRGQWTINQMIGYFSSSWVLSKPKGFEVWHNQNVSTEEQTTLQRQQADHWFAWQRLNGVTRNLIRKVKRDEFQQIVHIVDFSENNHPYLENVKLEKHIDDGKVFVVELTDMPAMSQVAMFVIWNKKLMPVAVILLEDKEINIPFVEGPVKDVQKWVKAKMRFNMVEAQYHESITHLGFTHFLMDGVSVCMHRHISDRHPIYKLLHPHFRYMHIINSEALGVLIGPGGFVDKYMNISHVQMLQLIAKINENRAYDLEANVERNCENRKVSDIPGYFFKEDAHLLRKAIHEFVNKYTRHYYQDDATVQADDEIQAFRKLLVNPRTMDPGGGCGMQGIPPFNTIQNLVDVVTNFIYICSVEHSATNFPQYDQYAFPPNFAAHLHLNDSENRLDSIIPNREETFSTIKIMKDLSLRLTNSLGKYERTYLKAMDDFGRTLVSGFQFRLDEISAQINYRNLNLNLNNNNTGQVQDYPYEWLLSSNVLNSISI